MKGYTKYLGNCIDRNEGIEQNTQGIGGVNRVRGLKFFKGEK